MTLQTIKDCPHCFTEMEEHSKVCPHCGKNVNAAKLTYRISPYVMAAGLLVFVVGIFVGTPVVILGLAIIGVGALLRVL